MSEYSMHKAPRQQRSRERVERILNSTRQLLREQGLEAITTTAIAQHAEIPVGSLYQYFPDKKAILCQIYAQYLEEVRAVMAEVLDSQSGKGFDSKVNAAIYKAVRKAERTEGIDAELERALYQYPELRLIDSEHREQMTEMMVAFLVRRGAKKPKAVLTRLANFMYYVSTGIWAYRSEMSPPVKETDNWESILMNSLADEIFSR